MTEAAPPPPPQPPVPATVLPYATPFGSTPGQGTWREGAKLITTTNASLPPTCVKCNAPADGSYTERKFYWLHPAWLLLIFVTWFALLIVALVLRKKATLRVGLCAHHQSHRNTLLALTWLLALVGIAAMIAGPMMADAYRINWLTAAGLIGGCLMLFAAAFTGFGSRVLVPKKIDNNYAWFKGCGSEFLEQFPPAR